MKTFLFEELSEAAKENVVNLYYADNDYQAFIEEAQKKNADEMPTVEDWAVEKNIKFNEEGERVAAY